MVVPESKRYSHQSIERSSDFGNKFGQPGRLRVLVLTFEHLEADISTGSVRALGFTKFIMLAGGIGYGS